MTQIELKGEIIMNFKIENNYLDITNYPSVEKHLEDMASQGWLIDRIINGNLFIYKKIDPEALDFSISPFEVETFYTKKTKEELEEFNSVCESVGWNYATKSYDLHIYFKEQGSEAIEIQTDEEEEFRTLEIIGKKYIRSHYIQIPMLLFFSWLILGRVSTGVYAMRNALTIIVVPLVPIGLILLITNLIHVKKFFKKNRENIELGKSIEFSQSKFYMNKLTFPLVSIVIFIIIAYSIYSFIFLRNKFFLIAFIPTLGGLIAAFIYRVFIKPRKKSLRYKKTMFALSLIISVLVSTTIFVAVIMGMVNGRNNGDVANIEDLKVLSVSDFQYDLGEEDGDLIRYNSILVPTSYDFYSFNRKYGPIRTEYSKVLTEGLASNLVNRYIKDTENALTGRFSREIEFYLEEGIFDSYLLRSGLTEDDLIALEGRDSKEVIQIAKNIVSERSIIEAKNLWNVDESYFLTYDKYEILIRNGKEVFYLEGLDFADPEIIEIVKNRLGLS